MKSAKESTPALSQAVRDVLAERERQINEEGFTPEKDDERNANGTIENIRILGAMAACYMNPLFANRATPPYGWPVARQWWKPGTYRQNLVKAISLGLAEIERLDRKGDDR
jgi:hypothetical protein